MKKVSIIIPVYNTEKYLANCVESVLHQTYSNIEIIIINDGSTDKSLEICRNYALAHNNIIFIDKPNTGQSDSRYIGFLKSSGDYIYCVDSDDSLEQVAVQTLVDGIESSGADMFYCRYSLNDENNKELAQTDTYKTDLIDSRDEIIKDALIANSIKPSFCIKICKRELWEKAFSQEIRELRFNEDYPLTVLFCLHSSRVGFSNKIIYNTLQRPGSTSRSSSSKLLTLHDSYFPLIWDGICKTGLGDSLKNHYYYGFSRVMYMSLWVTAYYSKNFKEYRSYFESLGKDSIFFSNDYRECIKKRGFMSQLIDSTVKTPMIFYPAAKVVSLIKKH